MSMSGNVTMVDAEGSRAMVINESGLETASVYDALVGPHPEVAALIKWTVTTQGDNGRSRQGGIFQRDRYVTPTMIFDQFRTAQDAAISDDVVSTVVESTESLAFGRMSFGCVDEDEEDVWNQISLDIDLDTRIREMWRELFTVSQFYTCTWWGEKSYKVRGTSDKGVKRKRTFDNLQVPIGLTMMDPLKVVPVGNLMFNMDQLAYIADRTEVDMLDAAVLNDPDADPVSRQIIVAKYAPPDYERRNLAKQGINADWLYVLNPRNVWRHTATRPQYRRFAEVRMTSIFELLDLKHQLRQMDRAHLIGAPLRVDQRIPTPEGWKPIGAARVGDKVYSVDGQTTDIMGVFPQGTLPMYRATFTDGAEVYCDASHLWTVTNRAGRSRTITLNQIMAEGLFDTNGAGKRVRRHRIPIASPLQLPERDQPLDPYLVGYLLGDGSLTQTIPKITCAEDDQPWREVLPAGVTVSQYETRPGFCPQYGLKGSRWHHNEVTEGLRAIGIWGMVDEDKYIPDDYLWASEGQRWALLQGLCDSDGHSHQAGGVEISTVSEKLAVGVVQLAQSLGGVAKINTRQGSVEHSVLYDIVPCCDGRPEQKGYAKVGEGWCSHCGEPLVGVPVKSQKWTRTLYRVWVSLHQADAPFRLARKVEKWKPRKVAYVRAFAKITRVEDAEAVCIKTARDDGLFLTEGMVVTHNTNFIVLIRKGTEHLPAKPEEITNLQAQVKTVAQVPILVGDHRLSVEIVTPKNDFTLSSDKYATIDQRIGSRLYQMFMVHGGSGSPRSDDSVKLAKVIARGMESRRFMMKRALERYIIRPTILVNEQLTEDAKLRFHPTRIELDFDAATVQFLLDLRDRGDLSRDSILNELDFDQEDEAIMRKREAKDYDDIFVQTNVPFSAPGPGHAVPVGPGGKPNEEPSGTSTNAPAAPAVAPHSHAPDGTPVGLPGAKTTAKPAVSPRSAGRAGGGNRNGGGAAPGSGQGQAPRRGRPSSK